MLFSGLILIKLNQVLHKRLIQSTFQVLATGLPASPSAASGIIIFDANEAEHRRENGKGNPCPLETTQMTSTVLSWPKVLTSRVDDQPCCVVARGMAACVCGCEATNIDYKEKELL